MKLVSWPRSSLEIVNALIHKSHYNNWHLCVSGEQAPQTKQVTFLPPKGHPGKELLGNSP